jgi:hypothetical protein
MIASSRPSRHQWLIPIILATQKTQIKRIGVQSRHWEIVHKTLSQKYQTPKKGWFKSPVPLKNKNKFETSLGNLARPRLKNKIKSGHQWHIKVEKESRVSGRQMPAALSPRPAVPRVKFSVCSTVWKLFGNNKLSTWLCFPKGPNHVGEMRSQEEEGERLTFVSGLMWLREASKLLYTESTWT